MRRILLLNTDLEIGGTPTVVREIALRLRHDADIQVACLGRWGPVADQLRDAGVAVAALGATHWRDWRVIQDLIALIRRERFDTVFSFLIHANTAAAVASLACREVRFIQSIQTTQPNPRWHWRLQRLVHHAADAIVVPSASAARVAMEWADVPREKIIVISNAVDLSDFGIADSALTSTIWQGTERGRMRIGFLGRLDPVKRVPDLIEAMALLDPSFTLEIFGEGDDRARIEREIERLQLRPRVTLHGAVANPRDALRQIDLLVLPSQAEGFGLVLIEAMSAGVPVIGTDVPGIRDVIRHERNGLLVPVGRPDEIAAAIQRITNSPEFRRRLIETARSDVTARFSWDVVLPKYRALLRLGAP